MVGKKAICKIRRWLEFGQGERSQVLSHKAHGNQSLDVSKYVNVRPVLKYVLDQK